MPAGPYSTDPDRYFPLCASCHKRFDLNHLAGKASSDDAQG